MPARHRPYRPKIKGCYQCSQRRINCDRAEPACAKCISKHLECSGLGIRHRFNDGIAARGKWAGKTIQSAYAESVHPAFTTSEQNTHESSPGPGSPTQGEIATKLIPVRGRAPASTQPAPSSARGHPRNHGDDNDDGNDIPLLGCQTLNTSANSLISDVPVSESTLPSELQHASVRSPEELERSVDSSSTGHSYAARGDAISPALFQPDPGNIALWKKILLSNFSENIANQMVAIDGFHNGWRHLALPIAHTDELVMYAVLAASAFHLSFNETKSKSIPPLSTQAVHRHCPLIKPQQYPDSGKLYARAIMGLKKRQELDADEDRHSVLLAILILLVAVMVTGSDDFPILLRMMQSAFEAVGGEEGLGRGVLAEFMIRQIHKMRVYAAPFLSEENGLKTLSSPEHTTQGLECLNHCSQQRPDAAAAVPLITSLMQQAYHIYLQQALREEGSSVIATPASDSTHLVQRFKETLEAFPDGWPGEQVLIWATFIAASDCVLDEHKAFFEGVFLRYFVRSGFGNILSGLEHLRRIWAHQRSCSERGRGRWTLLLPRTRVFVM